MLPNDVKLRATFAAVEAGLTCASWRSPEAFAPARTTRRSSGPQCELARRVSSSGSSTSWGHSCLTRTRTWTRRASRPRRGRRRASAPDRRGRRAPPGHPRVQRVDPGRPQECHRLGERAAPRRLAARTRPLPLPAQQPPVPARSGHNRYLGSACSASRARGWSATSCRSPLRTTSSTRTANSRIPSSRSASRNHLAALGARGDTAEHRCLDAKKRRGAALERSLKTDTSVDFVEALSCMSSMRRDMRRDSRAPLRWLGDSRWSRGHASTRWYLHCPYCHRSSRTTSFRGISQHTHFERIEGSE